MNFSITITFEELWGAADRCQKEELLGDIGEVVDTGRLINLAKKYDPIGFEHHLHELGYAKEVKP